MMLPPVLKLDRRGLKKKLYLFIAASCRRLEQELSEEEKSFVKDVLFNGITIYLMADHEDRLGIFIFLRVSKRTWLHKYGNHDFADEAQLITYDFLNSSDTAEEKISALLRKAKGTR